MIPNSENTAIECAGTLILAKNTKRFLMLLRTKNKSENQWGLAGGKIEAFDNSIFEALMREVTEEIGFLPNISKTVPIEHYASDDKNFYYNTYVSIVDEEFIPKLNSEHCGYAWVEYDKWPKPLHRGLRTTLYNKFVKTKIETILDMV